MSEPPVLTLYSRGLLSKWGFGDGDIPDHLWDYCDEIGLSVDDFDWHVVLCTLVRRHLLPLFEQEVEVYDIETIHNPIRAAKVDGVEIDDYADNKAVVLTPDEVEVSWAQVKTAIDEARSPAAATI